METLNPVIEAYARYITTPESPALASLNRETYAKVLRPRMLSGHLQGTLLSLLSKMVQPTSVLDIGTFTGYSAICLAAGLKGNGLVHTIDHNPELEDFAGRFIREAGLEKKIIQHIGEAIAIIPTIDEVFDLVFIDADKNHYVTYFDMVFDRLRSGGIVVADNVLWDGKAVQVYEAFGEEADVDEVIRQGMIPASDKETLGILRYNEHVRKHPGVTNLLLPFRDGLLISMKH